LRNEGSPFYFYLFEYLFHAFVEILLILNNCLVISLLLFQQGVRILYYVFIEGINNLIVTKNYVSGI